MILDALNFLTNFKLPGKIGMLRRYGSYHSKAVCFSFPMMVSLFSVVGIYPTGFWPNQVLVIKCKIRNINGKYIIFFGGGGFMV